MKDTTCERQKQVVISLIKITRGYHENFANKSKLTFAERGFSLLSLMLTNEKYVRAKLKHFPLIAVCIISSAFLSAIFHQSLCQGQRLSCLECDLGRAKDSGVKSHLVSRVMFHAGAWSKTEDLSRKRKRSLQ
jgi:hypothetical protein